MLECQLQLPEPAHLWKCWDGLGVQVLQKHTPKKITALDSCLKNKLGPRGLKSKLSQSVHREGCRLTEESDVQVAVGAVGTLFSSVTFPQSFKRSSQNPSLCWGCTSGIEKYSHKGHFLRAQLSNANEIQHCLLLALGGFGGFGVTEPHKCFKMAFKAICVSVGTDPSTHRTNSQQWSALGQRKMGANVPGAVPVLWD